MTVENNANYVGYSSPAIYFSKGRCCTIKEQ